MIFIDLKRNLLEFLINYIKDHTIIDIEVFIDNFMQEIRDGQTSAQLIILRQEVYNLTSQLFTSLQHQNALKLYDPYNNRKQQFHITARIPIILNNIYLSFNKTPPTPQSQNPEPQQELAQRLGVSESNISNILKAFKVRKESNLPGKVSSRTLVDIGRIEDKETQKQLVKKIEKKEIRPSEVDYKDKEHLIYMYQKLKQSAIEIAKQYGVQQSTIYYFLHKFKIPRRNYRERFEKEKCTFAGRHHTKETKQKMSKKSKERQHTAESKKLMSMKKKGSFYRGLPQFADREYLYYLYHIEGLSATQIAECANISEDIIYHRFKIHRILTKRSLKNKKINNKEQIENLILV